MYICQRPPAWQERLPLPLRFALALLIGFSLGQQEKTAHVMTYVTRHKNVYRQP